MFDQQQNQLQKTIIGGSEGNGGLIYKGTISVPADFPLPSTNPLGVKIGYWYSVLASVTDNDVTKTNTGSSFTLGEQIFWNGTGWVIVNEGSGGNYSTFINPSSGITATMTVTDKTWVNDATHGLIAGTKVWVSGMMLPPELSVETDYFVVNPELNRFELSLTLGGSPIEYTTMGSFNYYVRTAVACTFDDATDTVQKVGHGLSENDYIRLSGAGLPAELNSTTDYWIVGTPNANDFQISDSLGGTPLTFGAGNGNYFLMVPVAATINVPTNSLVNYASHGLLENQIVQFTGAGLPAELIPGTDYYVRDPQLNTYEVSLTYGGSPVDFSTAGTGKYYLMNQAVLSSVIDANIGVKITQFIAPTFKQTLGTPSTNNKMFYVINMIGSTFDITINDGTKDTTLSAGEGQAFFYDGSAWETVQDGAIWVDSGTDLQPFNDRHVSPKTDNNRSLGSIIKRWLNGYFSGKVSIGNTGAEPNATLEVLGSEAHQTTRTAIAVVLSSTDKYHTIIYTNAVGITQTLPAGAANVLNKEYEFVNRGTSTVSITDSAGTLLIVINSGESISFQWDGTEWIAK